MSPITHNGPICQTCGARYINQHSCSWEDLERRIDELREVQKRKTPSTGWIGDAR